MSQYITPELGKLSFHCPNCGVLAKQTWSKSVECYYIIKFPGGSQRNEVFKPAGTSFAVCAHCSVYSFWIDQDMIYPLTGNAEMPNEDLPDAVKSIYEEARSIVNISARGAAALLRLALQKLCVEIGEKGKNINDDIANLVKKGLPASVQQALDIVRVTGNHAVHPGTIELDDNKEVALALFGLINFVTNHFITQPNAIAALYSNLPERDRTNIEKRDS